MVCVMIFLDLDDFEKILIVATKKNGQEYTEYVL